MPITQVRGYNVIPGVINNANMLILTSGFIYYPESASAYEFTVASQFISQTTTAAPLVVSSTSIVNNLNAQYFGGYQPSNFIFANGSNQLTNNWNAGNYSISARDIYVSSTGLVNNLNAKYLEGYSISSLLSQFVRMEKPTGVVNGINFNYTVTGGTILLNTETIYFNGIALDPLEDYTITGQNFSLLLVSAPRSSDKIRVSYFKQL